MVVSYPVTKIVSFLGLSVMVVVGCGGATSESAVPSPSQEEEVAPAPVEPAPPPEEPKSSEVELVAAVPDVHCQEGQVCVPPAAFSKEFCKRRYPGLAVYMFEKSTPWKRMYVKAESLEHVNTYGGTTSKRLEFSEEVIVLRYQSGDSSGMKVSGASDVDVLRWDGTCATVREEMLSEHRMPTVKNATVIWRYLDDETRAGLLEAKYVKTRYDQQKDICRSSSATNPTEACQKATDKLNDAITVAVRGGLSLREPGELPVWKASEAGAP